MFLPALLFLLFLKKNKVDGFYPLLTGKSVIWNVWNSPPVRRAAVVGCGIQIFNQLAGINVIV